MKRVLIIDDNKEILTVIRLLLEMEGYQVFCKETGYDFFNSVFDCDPNLILLDVRLGEFDGREICKELKTNAVTKHIPIVMISASHQVDLHHWLADDFVAKPFDIDKLAATVSRHVA